VVPVGDWTAISRNFASESAARPISRFPTQQG
jgi:hypothetical protein